MSGINPQSSSQRPVTVLRFDGRVLGYLTRFVVCIGKVQNVEWNGKARKITKTLVKITARTIDWVSNINT
jgi:hypothetical protein